MQALASGGGEAAPYADEGEGEDAALLAEPRAHVLPAVATQIVTNARARSTDKNAPPNCARGGVGADGGASRTNVGPVRWWHTQTKRQLAPPRCG
jgi:hypothetical protein